MLKADLIIENTAEVATPQGSTMRTGAALGELQIISGGCLAAMNGEIVFVGSREELQQQVQPTTGARRIDARGGTVLPGFVDAHTHTVFAGDRSEEFNLRLQGHGYAEIARRGGGILSTVRATRAATEEELFSAAWKRLDSMARHGTTTIETKSGYGLNTETELKLLKVAGRLAEEHPMTIIPTFLGAHEVPPEFREKEDGMRAYARHVREEMLPAVAEQGIARYCDIFTETGVFDVDTSKKLLAAAQQAGLKLRVHVDQLTALGGAEMAAELGAVSADHLEFISDKGVRRLAESGTAAGLLPGCVFFLMMEEYPPARKLIDAGAPVILATDFNPGSSHSENMAMVMALACLQMNMNVAEALTASTLNPAVSLDLGDRIGSLEPGKRADLIILDAPSHYHLVYHWGVNLVRMTLKDGVVIAGE